MKAWHFTADTLRDGSPIPAIGETLKHEGRLVLCESGFHASKHPMDALRYAPGPMLHRVRLTGEIVKDTDKLVASERTILASVDATEMLRAFARKCALDVIHLWDAPRVVRRYLETGDEEVRDAASAAAWAAAWDAAWAAAWDAAWDAQRKLFKKMAKEAIAAASHFPEESAQAR